MHTFHQLEAKHVECKDSTPRKRMSIKPVTPYTELSPDEQKLVDMAREYVNKSYSPYSKFPVGAALLAENDKGERRMFGGCNVENASFPVGVCAERTTIVKAVSEGFKRLHTIAVVCPKSLGSGPCGVCRQSIREHGEDAQILVLSDMEGNIHRWELRELLPDSFGPGSL